MNVMALILTAVCTGLLGLFFYTATKLGEEQEKVERAEKYYVNVQNLVKEGLREVARRGWDGDDRAVSTAALENLRDLEP